MPCLMNRMDMTMINLLDDRYVFIFQGLTRAVTCILLLLSIKLYPQLGNYNWQENISVDKLKTCLWRIHWHWMLWLAILIASCVVNNKQFIWRKLKCNTTTVLVLEIIFMTSLGLLIRLLRLFCSANKLVQKSSILDETDGRMRRFNL